MILSGKSLQYSTALKFLSGLKSKWSSSNLEYLKTWMKVTAHVEVAYLGTAYYGF
jgi:hypothetical protein